MIEITNSTLFNNLLFFHQHKDISVNEIGFYIEGYWTKDSIGDYNEPWINDFLKFINLKTCKLYLNTHQSPQAYYGIITDHQENNEEGLRIFFTIFFEFCEKSIDDFRSNLETFKSRAITRLDRKSLNL